MKKQGQTFLDDLKLRSAKDENENKQLLYLYLVFSTLYFIKNSDPVF